MTQPSRTLISLRKAWPSFSTQTLPILIAEAAIVWAIVLRTFFFLSFPDPLPTPDTWSYLTGAYGLLERGEFNLFAQRTPVFPLIVWLVLVISKTFAGLTILSAMLTLFSAIAIGYVARVFGGPWRWPAALAVTFVVVNPHLLYWEHFVTTEGTFQAFFVLGLCAASIAILRPTIIMASMAGLLSAMAILTRPQGLFLVPLILIVLGWSIRKKGYRELIKVLGAVLIAPVLLIGAWSVRNARVNYFFGITNIGALQKFGVTARWIDLESPQFAQEKALIADSIRRYQSMPDDVNWVQYSPEGPAYKLDAMHAGNPRRRDEVLNGLAHEAFRKHPVAATKRGLSTTWKLMFGRVSHYRHFVGTLRWDQSWEGIAKEFSVDQHRAALDQDSYPILTRQQRFDEIVGPWLRFETLSVRISVFSTLLSFLLLPLLNAPRRFAVALGATSVLSLIVTAGFLSEAAERYMSITHGAAALTAALALTGLIERFAKRPTPGPSETVAVN